MKKGVIFWLLVKSLLLTVMLSCETEPPEQDAFNTTNFTSKKVKRISCKNFNSSNNLQSCSIKFLLPPITTESRWNIGNNGEDHIDHKIEQNFASAYVFSSANHQPCGPVIAETNGEVYFIENPGLNPVTFAYDRYNYLSSDSINAKNANKLQKHFACEITKYQNTYYPGWKISEVDIIGDSTLCSGTGISKRWLVARFKLTQYQCNNR